MTSKDEFREIVLRIKETSLTDDEFFTKLFYVIEDMLPRRGDIKCPVCAHTVKYNTYWDAYYCVACGYFRKVGLTNVLEFEENGWKN